MSSVIISGDTSGAITVSAPLVAGTNTLTLQAATATNAVNKLETAVASTSGVSIDYTSIPSWVKKITVLFSGVSSSGASNWLIRIGDGSIVATGYSGASTYWSSAVETIADTTGFPMRQQQATYTHFGAVSIFNISGNTWVASGVLGSATNTGFSCTGTKTLTGTLDRIRLTTVTGTDTFDAGTINLLLEG